MNTLRSYVDHDEQRAMGPTSFMTERNGHQVRCGMCARVIYVDDSTFRFAAEAIRSGLDNPFRCEICATEYDEMAYEGDRT